eukprot:CAMPEP_0113653444 /NCGR_PEP_ID=MMETSP0017_2-20120614/28587_1 /TAXON_ID=2856 /ORGANISM="Cylindrotheca closterium" /LENGTH=531 /DNA_ID=CAMNT_0000566447 /DNA_START=582 /DNA_END=2173 /DNA_ORIENTATION=- /assembly_acc=CAM_ASM_000147
MSSNQTANDDEQVTMNDDYSDNDETPDNSSPSSLPAGSLNAHDYTLRSALPTLITSILLGLVSGTAYGFGRYARTLKEVLGLSQSEVQALGVFMDCGNYVGHPLVGIIYDRKGPEVSCLLGALLAFVSYWKIRWTLLNNNEDDDLSDVGILWLELAFFGVGFSSGLGYISGLGEATKALLRLTGSSSRYFGTGIGLVAAGCGLSSTLVGLSYQHSPNLPSFFLFWALIVPVVSIGAAIMFQIQSNSASVERLAEANGPRMEQAEPLLCSPTLESAEAQSYQQTAMEEEVVDEESVALMETSKSSVERLAEANGPREEVGPLICSPTLESTEAQSCQQTTMEEEVVVDEDSVALMETWDAWKKLEFWLLFASFSCASGCGLFVINNVSTIVQSMGGSDSLAGTLVIVLSISNVCGRILMGMLGDAAATSNSTVLPRIRLLQGVNLTMALAMFLAFLGGQQQVCVILFVVVVAVAYGSTWVLIVALTPKLFAKEHFGKSYGLLALGPAMAGLVFNQTSAKWYEQHASNNTCIG